MKQEIKRIAWIGIIGWMASCHSSSVLGDWPGFLGPERDGVARDAEGLLREWPNQGPTVLWSVDVGEGFAGPAIADGFVYLLDREPNKQDILRKLNLEDGREVWQYAYAAPGKLNYNGSRTTPTVDDDLIFTVGPFGHVHAVAVENGHVLWSAHLLEDWKSKRPGWGVSQSPLVYEDRVVVMPWGSRASVVAYERHSGKVIWRTPNQVNLSADYQSPVFMTLDGRPTVVVAGRQGYVMGVDLKTGARLWDFKEYNCRWHIPSPILIPEDRIFLTGGYNAGSVMMRIEKRDRDYEAKKLWANKSVGSKIAQAVYLDGYLYSNSADVNGGLRCTDLDGKVVWDSKEKGRTFEMGNLLVADNLIFLMHGQEGILFLVEATPREYHELAQAKILEKPNIWAPMAYAQGKLLLRDMHRLVCVEVK